MIDLNTLSLGFEFGSTRIKAVVINAAHEVIASSEYGWENQFVNGVWTYSMNLVEEGMRTAFAGLLEDFYSRHGERLTTVGSMGVSGMMHGYLVLDQNNNVLAPFRTWRNTMTGEEAKELTDLFGFNIPQRWSIAHIYHSLRKGDPEVPHISYATTLAGYIHYRLCGKRVIGVGEASGMFPIDPSTNRFNKKMAAQFDTLVSGKVPWKILDILPEPLLAGEDAGTLTEEGALFLDPTGTFRPGVRLVPPEGDMGTGMVATHSVAVHTGNASIGTSSNLTVVTDEPIAPDPRIDIISGPSGNIAALIHVNNGTSEINQWVKLIAESSALGGKEVSKGELYERLFRLALDGDPLAGGLLLYNTASGEPMLGINEGRPTLVRMPDSLMSLANIMKANIYSLLCPLRIGLDLLRDQGVHIDRIIGHGGFFKTRLVGATMLSASTGVPVRNLYSSAEGGPYGMAILAAYALEREKGESLEDYLDRVFASSKEEEYDSSDEQRKDFDAYYQKYKENVPSLMQIIERYRS